MIMADEANVAAADPQGEMVGNEQNEAGGENEIVNLIKGISDSMTTLLGAMDQAESINPQSKEMLGNSLAMFQEAMTNAFDQSAAATPQDNAVPMQNPEGTPLRPGA